MSFGETSQFDCKPIQAIRLSAAFTAPKALFKPLYATTQGICIRIVQVFYNGPLGRSERRAHSVVCHTAKWVQASVCHTANRLSVVPNVIDITLMRIDRSDI